MRYQVISARKCSCCQNGLKAANAGDTVLVITVTDIVVVLILVKRLLRTVLYIPYWLGQWILKCLSIIYVEIVPAAIRFIVKRFRIR